MRTRFTAIVGTVGRFVRRLWHPVEHLCGWNTGTCHSFWDGDRLFMSFKCGYCGKLSGVHDITDRLTPNVEVSREERRPVNEL